MPTGIDQSWGFADPDKAKAAGVQVVSGYLSWDNTKNWTAAKIDSYHAVGIAVMLNWESQAGAAAKGWSQGHADAVEACRQAKALIAAVKIKPSNKLTIYFSCDMDADPAAIEAYYQATQRVTHDNGFNNGVYGSARVVADLASKGITDSEWQTYAWSNGLLAPAADFYQYQNGQNLAGASVDFDKVIHPDQLGAWWPKPLTPPAPPVQEFTLDAAAKARFDQSDAEIAALKSQLTDLQTAVNNIVKALSSGVNVNGLLDWGHKGHPSIESFLSGIPGYVAYGTRNQK